MPFNNIKELLKNKIGLNADTVGASSIERAISHRMSILGLSTVGRYYSLLSNDPTEIDELIEEVVVPETWFFRNKTPFEALGECVSETGFLNKDPAPRTPLKILSLPCATGEEPYSIAMALRGSGLAEGDFYVDGVDVSKRAIAKARRAIYGQHSFREDGVNIQEKYFKKTRAGFHVSKDIREYVSFTKANIISDNICPSNEFYDIIFCRNLLIYFSRETQKIVLDKLRLMLKSGGFLFVGHAEAAQINSDYFEKLNIPKTFAYRKTKAVVSSEMNVGSVDKLKGIYDQLVEVARKDTILSNKIKQPVKIKKYRSESSVGVKFSYSKVEKLIESGHYDEATSLCEGLLVDDPENADGYYYLGLIGNIRGSYGGAESLLKKAIYLSPNHQKALGLSVLLAESRGDHDSADYYRRRAIKARERNK